MMKLQGPMFEPEKSKMYRSIYKKSGAHYNIFEVTEDLAMDALREMFEDGEANDLNFCLFSTSGIHGSYVTIEECEQFVLEGNDEGWAGVTFLIIQPRICCLRYGNCYPKTDDDFRFLKRLRQSSFEAMEGIGLEVGND